MRFTDERAAIVAAAHRLAARGLTFGTGGNLSIRIDDAVVMTPSGCYLDSVTADQLVVVDLDGTVVEETPYVPTSELHIHLDVYKSTSARAVVHAHPVASIAVSNLTDELPVVHYTKSMLGGAIRVAPYAVFGSRELSDGVVAALADRTVALMRNHGSVGYGNTLESACDSIELLDWLARIHLQAPGGTVLDQAQVVEVLETATRRHYRAFRGGSDA